MGTFYGHFKHAIASVINNHLQLTQGVVDKVSIVRVEVALTRMKRNRELGPNSIPINAWISLGEIGTESLTKLFDKNPNYRHNALQMETELGGPIIRF